MDIGNRIKTAVERPDRSLVDQFRGIPSSNIGDMMNRLFNMDAGIKAYGRPEMLGTAFTVRCPEGDNVFLHLAIELAQPGDVIVVNGFGCLSRALMGEMMFTYAKACGIAGFVLDGAIRDVESLAQLDLPVYARGVTPQGPLKNGLGEINHPIACGGQVVMPGDIICADADGVLVIPKADAYKVTTLSQEKFAKEQEKLVHYRKGEINRDAHHKTYLAVTDKIGTLFE